MDAMDILGSLLGGKAQGGGRGADILRDIFGRSGGNAPQPESRGQAAPGGRQAPQDDRVDAGDLEELLNVAVNRTSNQRSAPPPMSRPPVQANTMPPSRPAPAPRPAPPQYQPRQQAPSQPQFPREQEASSGVTQNDQALILVRAMVSAAKADGQVSQAEQQTILEQLGGASAETVQFLRSELSRPLDVRELAWNVPLGLEEQVYAISLMALDLDTQAEAEYLAELAQGLRLRPDVCNRIHERYHAPVIFQ